MRTPFRKLGADGETVFNMRTLLVDNQHYWTIQNDLGLNNQQWGAAMRHKCVKPEEEEDGVGSVFQHAQKHARRRSRRRREFRTSGASPAGRRDLCSNGGHVWTDTAGVWTHGPLPPAHVHQGVGAGRGPVAEHHDGVYCGVWGGCRREDCGDNLRAAD